jgi:hypothetical protein
MQWQPWDGGHRMFELVSCLRLKVYDMKYVSIIQTPQELVVNMCVPGTTSICAPLWLCESINRKKAWTYQFSRTTVEVSCSCRWAHGPWTISFLNKVDIIDKLLCCWIVMTSYRSHVRTRTCAHRSASDFLLDCYDFLSFPRAHTNLCTQISKRLLSVRRHDRTLIILHPLDMSSSEKINIWIKILRTSSCSAWVHIIKDYQKRERRAVLYRRPIDVLNAQLLSMRITMYEPVSHLQGNI